MLLDKHVYHSPFQDLGSVVLVQRFSGYFDQDPLKFWHMRTDKRVRGMCLHHLHVGVLPVSTHDIDLMMNTQYSGLDFKYKACFNRPYCANFLKGSWSSNLYKVQSSI